MLSRLPGSRRRPNKKTKGKIREQEGPKILRIEIIRTRTKKMETSTFPIGGNTTSKK
jgi:hypothetical protein